MANPGYRRMVTEGRWDTLVRALLTRPEGIRPLADPSIRRPLGEFPEGFLRLGFSVGTRRYSSEAV